jgi:hypothetical protein
MKLKARADESRMMTLHIESLHFTCTPHQSKKRDSSVGIALGYWLDDQMIGVRFPAGGWEFFSSPPRPDRL